jgi:nucleoside-diphosphate-sugar epimerase
LTCPVLKPPRSFHACLGHRSQGIHRRPPGRLLKQRGHSVTGVDLDLFAGCAWEPCAAADRELITDVRALDPRVLEGHDAVCHLAAISNDPMGDLDEALTLSVNRDASIRLARLCKRAGVPRFPRRRRGVVPTWTATAVRTSTWPRRLRPIHGALPAFSPYGLSKAFTSETSRYLCDRHGVSFGRFVIANPFGPMEERRFTSSLVRSWRAGETPQVRTPDYVRDNIHVSLLARAYADFAARLPDGGWSALLGPSGYRETQGEFAQRFAREIGKRLDIATPLDLLEQPEWDEPAVRLNVDQLDTESLAWDEAAAWDGLAGWYSSSFSSLAATARG